MKQRKALLQSRVSLGLHMAGVFGVGAGFASSRNACPQRATIRRRSV
jgi:hypothetical protein